MMRTRIRYRDVVVPAIIDDELPKVLTKLGLYNDVVNGKAKCYICERALTLNSIGAIIMVNDKLALICDKPSCIAKATQIIRRQKLKLSS
jgi:hypothetical protein